MSVRPELWDFPHRMMLKVMGESRHDLQTVVLEQLQVLQIEHEPDSCAARASGKGTFISISVMVCVKDHHEVEALYRTLSERPEVRVIL